MNHTTDKISALLLIGPTGSGKSPLGDLCGEKGLWGKKCFHFDFGESLRLAATGKKFRSFLTEEDVRFIQKVLKEGALLENDTFYIAENILRAFIKEQSIAWEDILMLNGLPRHKDQADDVGKIAAIRTVIHIKCTPETIRERIRLNTGGDRTNREDDSLDEIENKLNIFNHRTMPLIDYFKNRGARIINNQVKTDTTAETLYNEINQGIPAI